MGVEVTQKFCYSALDETGGLDLEEEKERGRSTGSLPASLAGVAFGVGRVPAGIGVLDRAVSGRKEVRSGKSVESTEYVNGAGRLTKEESCNRCSFAQLGKIRFGGEEGVVKVFS